MSYLIPTPVTLSNKPAHAVLIGPTSGTAPATFRSLVAGDLPNNVALADISNTFAVSQTFQAGFTATAASGVISIDSGGNVTIDTTTNITIGPNAPTIMSITGVATTIYGGDSISLSCGGQVTIGSNGCQLGFFGQPGAGQQEAPDSGGTVADRITYLEGVLTAYGLLASP
jgi:hypothetical protein